MPVPTLISQLSTTASLNSPDGAVDVPSSIDDYQRAHAAFIAQLYANTAQSVDIQNQTVTAFTTGGTSTAFTLTPTPAITANAANQRFRVKFNAAAGATPTLAVSGLTALNLKYKDSAGAKQAITSVQVPINWVSDVENDGTDWVVLDVPPSAASTTVSGIVELATSAEAIAGSDAVRAITPATLFGGLNASGSAPIYACRAWVNFNGTGTVAISASGNVSSITDNGVGTYTINFTTSMPTPNYAVFGTANFSTGIAWIAAPSSGGTKSVSQVAIAVVDSANFADLTNVSISVFC